MTQPQDNAHKCTFCSKDAFANIRWMTSWSEWQSMNVCVDCGKGVQSRLTPVGLSSLCVSDPLAECDVDMMNGGNA